MITRNNNTFLNFFTALVILSLALASCAPGSTTSAPPQEEATGRPGSTGAPAAQPTASQAPTNTTVPTSTPVPTLTPIPLPAYTLKPGDFYFSVDGKPSFIFSRNLNGFQESHYGTFLDWTAAGGSKIARIQVESLGMGYTSKGEVDESWAARWDRIFDIAQKDGLYIIPVFSVWYDWNGGEGYSTWKSNPLNEANGGPVKSPAELFTKDSPTQKLWCKWLQNLILRWQLRKNVLAWEIFSEVNIAGQPSESAGIYFVNRAAELVRAADAFHRPVTASIADTGLWPNFYASANIDFINIHPYPPNGRLDRNIISAVRQSLVTYNRPVLIGESGLSAATPDVEAGKLTVAKNAIVGVKHAIWAGVVSGAMNGRSLWWEDSVAVAFPSLDMPFISKYNDIEGPAVKFVSGMDFSGFKPVTGNSSYAVWGAALGNEKTIIGWYRDATCEPPDWNLQPVISGQTVTLTVLGSAASWQVDFYNTKTGADIISSITVPQKGNTVTITLPDFSDDIAFKMVKK